MKIINLKGRLGNNLFQYALYISLKKTNRNVFVYGWDPGFQKYFEKIPASDSILLRKIINKSIKLFCKRKLTQYDFQPVIDVMNGIKKNTVLDGYFQSLSFFKNSENEIKNQIRIKEKYISEFDDKFGTFYTKNKILSIHCRLGDYVSWGNESLGGKNLVLPITYYKNALKKIKDIHSYKIYIITDDKTIARDRFSFLENIEVYSENEIIDFQLLKNSSAIIISNSTFSWWAAYLSTTAKFILAPEFFVGFKIKKDFPEGIYEKTNFEIIPFDY